MTDVALSFLCEEGEPPEKHLKMYYSMLQVTPYTYDKEKKSSIVNTEVNGIHTGISFSPATHYSIFLKGTTTCCTFFFTIKQVPFFFFLFQEYVSDFFR